MGWGREECSGGGGGDGEGGGTARVCDGGTVRRAIKLWGGVRLSCLMEAFAGR